MDLPPAHVIDAKTTFESMKLDERIRKALLKMKFAHPTLIQSTAIPLALRGKDIVAQSMTGSGKTAAYSIPILQILLTKEASKKKGDIGALVLVPTGELVQQVKNHFIVMASFCRSITVVGLAGDEGIQLQLPRLQDPPDIIVATPGRLVEHIKRGSVVLGPNLQMIVVDEADLVLSYGYEKDLKIIKDSLPNVCQTFLMSATFSPAVMALKSVMSMTPAVIRLKEEVHKTSMIKEYTARCSKDDKYLVTYALIVLKILSGKTLIFVNSVKGCYRLKVFLERFGLKAAALNSNLPQNSRYHTIQEFNQGVVTYLVATDDSVGPTDEDAEDEESEESEADDFGDDSEDEEGKSGEEESNEEGESDEEESEEEEEVEEQKPKKSQAAEQKKGVPAKAAAKTQQGKSPQQKKGKGNKDAPQKGQEYGVARGIDFVGVDTVLNFDCPLTLKSYIHRVGRTGRGGARGTALTLVDPHEEKFARIIEKKGRESGRTINPYKFNTKALDALRYRVEDVLSLITKKAVAAAMQQDVKNQMLNSEKLKEHFRDNPHELQLLRSDARLTKDKDARYLHLKKSLPTYLIPKDALGNLGIPSKKHGRSTIGKEKTDKKAKDKGHKKRKF